MGGQGELLPRSGKPKDPALGSSTTTTHTPIPTDYDSHKGGGLLDSQAVPRHASTESQHRAMMLSQQQQSQLQQQPQHSQANPSASLPKAGHDQKIKQIIRIQQSQGRNLLNMSQ